MKDFKNHYLKFIQNTFSDWEKFGYCQDAKKINEIIGYEYFGITNPHFFTGVLDSDFVLIHLNPKRYLDSKNNIYPKYSAKESGFNNFEDYINYYSNFGKINYGFHTKLASIIISIFKPDIHVLIQNVLNNYLPSKIAYICLKLCSLQTN